MHSNSFLCTNDFIFSFRLVSAILFHLMAFQAFKWNGSIGLYCIQRIICFQTELNESEWIFVEIGRETMVRGFISRPFQKNTCALNNVETTDRPPCLGTFYCVSAMSHGAIYRQPGPGNLHEGKTFTFQCFSRLSYKYKTMFGKCVMCYQSRPVACTGVGCLQVACKSYLVWQGP